MFPLVRECGVGHISRAEETHKTFVLNVCPAVHCKETKVKTCYTIYQTFKYHPQNIMCYMGCNIQTETEDAEGLRHASAL